MNDITSLIETAQKEFEASKSELEKQFEKKKSALLLKVKTRLAESLTEALKIYESIPDNVREGILSDAVFGPLIRGLGLAQGKAKARKQRTAAPKVTDEEILAYVSSERKTGDVQAKFNLSAVTVGKKLGDLLKAKSVSMRKEGTSKYWKKL